MQTFLPYPDYQESAKTLDRQRLGKQRVEVLQILRVLTGQPSQRTLSGHTRGWQNHPAVRMWRGHEGSLADYGIAICDEWIARGYKDTCRDKIARLAPNTAPSYRPPPWLGREDFHAAHRSNLLRKAPEHYGALGWTEPDDLPYVWPV